jgi:hypothetical protein
VDSEGRRGFNEFLHKLLEGGVDKSPDRCGHPHPGHTCHKRSAPLGIALAVELQSAQEDSAHTMAMQQLLQRQCNACLAICGVCWAHLYLSNHSELLDIGHLFSAGPTLTWVLG